MKYFEDMKYENISEILDTSVGGLKANYHHAVKKIENSVIKNLVITDTIDNNDKIKGAKNIEVLPISGLMGEAIKRISNSTSVSDLFK